MSDIVKWPFGNADVQTPDYAATLEVEINDNKTLLSPAQLTGDVTVNLTIDSALPVGAQLIVRAQSDGTARTFTPGTGMEGLAVAGVINKTQIITYEFDGTNFVHSSTVQID